MTTDDEGRRRLMQSTHQLCWPLVTAEL